ncbi:MAG: DNA primase [bacterium]
MQLREIKEKIRERSPIVEIMSEYIRLQKVGAKYRTLCPFHQDTKPSLYIDPEREMFYCFGCGAGGDVFNFIMLIEKYDFASALRHLAEKAGITIDEIDERKSEKDRLMEIITITRQFYEKKLREASEEHPARRFITERGIGDKWLEFSLGWTGDSLNSLREHLKKTGINENDGVLAGVLYKSENDFRDYIYKRITFTINNHRGKGVAFTGRALSDEEPKYLNTPNTEIFHKGAVLYNLDRALSRIKETKRAIIVEGQMDVIGLLLVGIDEVVAPMGTALTTEHAQLIARFANSVYLMFDGDSAGERATIRSLPILFAKDIETFVARPPDGLDPDDLARKEGIEGVERLLEKAMPGWDYMMKLKTEEYDISTPMGKTNLLDAFKEPLASIRDEMKRSIFIEDLAKILKIESRIIRDGIESFRKTQSRRLTEREGVKTTTIDKKRQPPVYEIELLNILLTDETYLKRAKEEIDINGITDLGVRAILNNAFQEGEKGGFDIKAFTNSMGGDEAMIVSRALFLDVRWDRETAYRDIVGKINEIGRRCQLADKIDEIFG